MVPCRLHRKRSAVVRRAATDSSTTLRHDVILSTFTPGAGGVPGET